MLPLTTLETTLRDEIAAAPDPPVAMRRTVDRLAREVDRYTWVGIYLLEGEELVLGQAPTTRNQHPTTKHRCRCYDGLNR